MKRLLVAVLLAGALALPSPPSSAITYGELDGGRHVNVGALLYDYDETNPGLDPACSGTLIRNDTRAVFLTAWHCDPDFEKNGDVVHVSFDRDVKPVTSRTTLHRGRFYGHPQGFEDEDDPKDVAVVVLDSPIPGLAPARLPTLGQLRRMKIPDKWTVVGYGVTETQQITWLGDGQRRKAVSGFHDLGPVFLTLSQDWLLKGEGGTCVIDSGGPVFPGTGKRESSTVMAITHGGDLLCSDYGEYYRLDTVAARKFLDDYVKLR